LGESSREKKLVLVVLFIFHWCLYCTETERERERESGLERDRVGEWGRERVRGGGERKRLRETAIHYNILKTLQNN